jgi:hypothetical protein
LVGGTVRISPIAAQKGARNTLQRFGDLRLAECKFPLT